MSDSLNSYHSKPVYTHRSYMPFEGMKVRAPRDPGEDVPVPEHLREGVRRLLAAEKERARLRIN